MEEKKINYEVRSSVVDFETRNDQEEPMVSGYFVRFDDEFKFAPDMSERIDPHAFDETLGNDIKALYDHDTSKVLGRTGNGTLTLRVDDKGVWGDLLINPKDSEAMSIYSKIKRQDVSGASFGFTILDQEPITRSDGGTQWVVKKVDLVETSITAFPAYSATHIVATRTKQVDDIKAEKQKAWKENLLKKLKGEKDGTQSVDD